MVLLSFFPYDFFWGGESLEYLEFVRDYGDVFI